MKYRIAGIAAMVLVLLAVFLADNVDTENPEKRVHQHLTARQPDAGCDCDGTTLCTTCLCWSLIQAAWSSPVSPSSMTNQKQLATPPQLTETP